MVRKHISVCIPLPHITDLVCFLNRLYVFGCVCIRPNYNRYMLYYNYCNMIYVYTKIKNICVTHTQFLTSLWAAARLSCYCCYTFLSWPLSVLVSSSRFTSPPLRCAGQHWVGGWCWERREGQGMGGEVSLNLLQTFSTTKWRKHTYINIHISHCKNCA